MDDLRIGLIGVGGRGGLAAFAHKPGEGSRLVAGADPSDAALTKFKEKYGEDLFVTHDYRELLKRDDIQAVFITAPDFLHEEMAIAALEAGKAVYLEKPMTITIEGCDRVLETAYRTGSKLYLGHNTRHCPVINKMKEIIDSGLIGEVQAAWCRHFINYGGDAYFKDWHSEQKNTTGLLLQKGAHDIDVIHYLCGGYTRKLNAMGRLSVYNRCQDRRDPSLPGCAAWSDSNWPPLTQKGLSPIIDVEDHNMVLMELDNGVQAAYLQCHYTPDAERNYTFIGTCGRVENIGDSDQCEVHVWTTRGPRETPDIIYKLKPVPGSHGGSDPDIVKTFIDFVRFDKPVKTSPIAARNSVAVGVLAHESMRSDGGLREVPPVPEYLINYFDNGQHKA